MDEKDFISKHGCAYDVVPKKIDNIEIDDNLRKVKRNQEIVTSTV
jgi:hypothetical protein